MKIVMHPSEVDLFRSFLKEATNYFEYGVGGSTYLASQLVKGEVHGVDSDRSWVDKVAQEVGAHSRVRLRHVDIGPTGQWGYPVSKDSSASFPAYSQAILESGRNDFDLCLVDGRFRVACFLQALIYLPHGAIVGMHDYTSRPEYHLIERYARPVASVEELKFFVRRQNADEEEIKAELDQYRLNWA